MPLPFPSLGKISTKVSATLIIAVFTGCFVQLIAAFYLWGRSDDIRAQWAYAGLAHDFAAEIGDLLPITKAATGPTVEKLREIAARYQRYNPAIDIYLLSHSGEIVHDFAAYSDVERRNVDVNPLEAYLAEGDHPRLPRYADDPSTKSSRTIFSVARIGSTLGGGYVYVTLENAAASRLTELIQEDASFATFAVSSLVAFATVVGISLFAFRPIAARFTGIVAQLGSYGRGDFRTRAGVVGGDELTEIAVAANSMADSIEHQIAQLNAKDRLRRELILDTWHDLRGPINSIQHRVELLMAEDRQSEQTERGTSYNVVLRSSGVLNQLLSELHELLRLETGELAAKIGHHDIRDTLEDVREDFTIAARAKGVDVVTEYPEALPSCGFDPVLILRVLRNLTENALRYTDSGGRITLGATQSDDGGVVVAVRDTGVGIESSDISRLFERHFQGDGTAAKPKGASGLGLAIVRKIVEKHGSEIRVESTPGSGTTFSFTLQPVSRPGLSTDAVA